MVEKSGFVSESVSTYITKVGFRLGMNVTVFYEILLYSKCFVTDQAFNLLSSLMKNLNVSFKVKF